MPEQSPGQSLRDLALPADGERGAVLAPGVRPLMLETSVTLDA